MAKLSRNTLVIVAALFILVIVLFGITILRDDENPLENTPNLSPPAANGNGTILRDDDNPLETDGSGSSPAPNGTILRDAIPEMPIPNRTILRDDDDNPQPQPPQSRPPQRR
jgi:hypothetical protein